MAEPTVRPGDGAETVIVEGRGAFCARCGNHLIRCESHNGACSEQPISVVIARILGRSLVRRL